MLMKAEINGVEDTVLFDSGSSIAAILFYTDENKPKGMRFYKVPLLAADKKTKIRMTYIPVTIKHIITEPVSISSVDAKGFQNLGG